MVEGDLKLVGQGLGLSVVVTVCWRRWCLRMTGFGVSINEDGLKDKEEVVLEGLPPRADKERGWRRQQGGHQRLQLLFIAHYCC